MPDELVQQWVKKAEDEPDFFRIYSRQKQGLEVAPTDPHKRTLRDIYLQGVDTLAGVGDVSPP